jgi:hypothetical protein
VTDFSGFSRVRMSVLVDWDPHGLGIATVYRSGSMAQLHSPLRLAAGARLGWLGVRGLADGEVAREATVPLTDADRRAALGLLNRESLPEEWRCVCVGPGAGHGLDSTHGCLTQTRCFAARRCSSCSTWDARPRPKLYHE